MNSARFIIAGAVLLLAGLAHVSAVSDFDYNVRSGLIYRNIIHDMTPEIKRFIIELSEWDNKLTIEEKVKQFAEVRDTGRLEVMEVLKAACSCDEQTKEVLPSIEEIEKRGFLSKKDALIAKVCREAQPIIN